jgi:hypothetical protein
MILTRLCAAAALAWLAAVPARAQTSPPQTPAPRPDAVTALVNDVERALLAGSTDAYLSLLAPTLSDRAQAAEFAAAVLTTGASEAVVEEADRAPLLGAPEGHGYRLMVEVFVRRDMTADVSTWRLDVRDDDPGLPAPAWRIVAQERLTAVQGLYSLGVDPTRQFDVRDLTVTAEDLTLQLPVGAAFVAETELGPTALILLGRGRMEFSPAPAAERGQIRILTGADTLAAEFDSAFIRLNPGEYDERVATGALTLRSAVNRRDLRRAVEIFDREAPRSFALDLGRLSQQSWWVLPAFGDILFEVKTRKYDTLTYVRSGAEPEDIRLFDRKRKRNISLYPSRGKTAARGRFYNEDEFTEYDVLDYDIEASLFPDREWIQGQATLRVRAKTPLLSMSVRLADALRVETVTARPFGRLLPLRAPGQDSILISFPTAIPEDFEFAVTVTYSGPLVAQRPEHETLLPQEGPFISLTPSVAPQEHYLYSSRSYWYPQAMITDYATAKLRLRVPPGYECISSGDPDSRGAVVLPPTQEGETTGGKQYLFVASQPVRYLAAVVSRFTGVQSAILPVGDAARAATDGHTPTRSPGVFYDSLALSVQSNPRQVRRGRDVSGRAQEIVRFYGKLLGDVPYPSVTLAVVESEIPGGHSPAYFALLNQPLPSPTLTWRNDPVNFEDFPDFFLAHELAHQWWGQAVGWNNYHEQWLSEGFAQYFAALYARESRGEQVFAGVLARMRRYALQYADQGPVYLGYRLGHIKGQSRVFRALVYNKGALVLHMLRRLVGDEAFFGGLRRFYTEFRFKKAGTNDFQRAMEAEAGMPLERFFERWVFEPDHPRLTFSYQLVPAGQPAGGESGGSAGDAVVRFEQSDRLFDIPVTVTFHHDNGTSTDVVVRIREAVTEMRVPLGGLPVRDVELNRDAAALATFVEP